MMEIVAMAAAHVPQVAALETQCFSAPWSQASLASELDNPLALWLVAMDGGQVAGYVGAQSVLGEADMMNLAVAQAYRRQGIGQALVKELVKRLSAGDVHCLSLEVRSSNQAAQALYAKLGFFQAGRRPGYYRHPTEDALILRLEWRS